MTVSRSSKKENALNYYMGITGWHLNLLSAIVPKTAFCQDNCLHHRTSSASLREERMTDNLSPGDRRRTMQAIKSKKTGPERKLRAVLAGLRLSGWCLNYRGIPGCPDVAFPEQKIAVFIDGCFWHGCPVCNRPLPKTNPDYWRRKIQRNIERDREYDTTLAAMGWRVHRIWEHQLRRKSDYKDFVAELLASLALSKDSGP